MITDMSIPQFYYYFEALTFTNNTSECITENAGCLKKYRTLINC